MYTPRSEGVRLAQFAQSTQLLPSIVSALTKLRDASDTSNRDESM
jgi:hypothetical protein